MRLKETQAELQSRNAQLETDLKKSHSAETLLQTHVEEAEKKVVEMVPLAQENERLKQELEGLHKLRDENAILRA